MADDTIDARLARLEALIESMTAASPHQASADAAAPPATTTGLDPAVLDHLATVAHDGRRRLITGAFDSENEHCDFCFRIFFSTSDASNERRRECLRE